MGRPKKKMMPLKWHEKNLFNMKIHYEGLNIELKSLMNKVERMANNIEDLEKAIICAKAKGITELSIQ